MNFQFPQSTHNNPTKYKTMLCKHFTSPKGCSFGDKCQFAHGEEELKGINGIINPMMIPQKKGPNPQNYKIVKCKYWEKDGTCCYGTLCSFAHGDAELRTKSQNMMNQASMGNGDISKMYSMDPNPYMMGFDPIMAMPNFMQFQQDPKIMNQFLLNMGTQGGYPQNI